MAKLLASIYMTWHRIPEGDDIARTALRWVRSENLWAFEGPILKLLLEGARQRGDIAMARAYAREVLQLGALDYQRGTDKIDSRLGRDVARSGADGDGALFDAESESEEVVVMDEVATVTES